jgi:HNH endonuclease
MRGKKILLLNASFEVLSFITERKALKLLAKEKVEIIEFWNDYIHFANGKWQLPAVLRLKNHVRRSYFNSNFSRKALVKRDRSICQYCNKLLSASQITVDHILPRSAGGKTSFMNCVVACFECNNKKNDRTPEQANMPLLRKPVPPSFTSMYHIIDFNELWHWSWDDYLKI